MTDMTLQNLLAPERYLRQVVAAVCNRLAQSNALSSVDIRKSQTSSTTHAYSPCVTRFDSAAYSRIPVQFLRVVSIGASMF